MGVDGPANTIAAFLIEPFDVEDGNKSRKDEGHMERCRDVMFRSNRNSGPVSRTVSIHGM